MTEEANKIEIFDAPKTADDLRMYLAHSMKKLNESNITAATANGMANLAGKILSITKQELEYHRLKGTKTESIYIPFIQDLNRNNQLKIEEKKEEVSQETKV